jgi:uncharacterized protein YdhG (YjbR/CyaY superfamily)
MNKLSTSVETVQEYINDLPEDRKQAIEKLREVILENLPEGFVEVMGYGMPGYVIPHSIYPKGYHTDPKLPLPFINIASQNNYILFYHMGVYANNELLEWFTNEYPKYSKTKLDMGKGCIRFKKIDQIPYMLIGELVGKISSQEWIDMYESVFIKK